MPYFVNGQLVTEESIRRESDCLSRDSRWGEAPAAMLRAADEQAAGNNAANEYEFYNYSPNLGAGSLSANPQEIGNQYFDGSLAVTAEAQAYLNDFNTSGVQSELYSLNSSGGGPATQQVVAAVQQAWTDYKSYLTSIRYLAGNDGRPYQPAPAANNAFGGWDQIFDPI